jgi:hypothetical protein
MRVGRGITMMTDIHGQRLVAREYTPGSPTTTPERKGATKGRMQNTHWLLERAMAGFPIVKKER